MSQIYKVDGSPAPDVEKIQGDTGGPVGPDPITYILNLLGHPDINVAGNPATYTQQLTNLTKVSPYVVGPVGQARFQTIQAAINQAALVDGLAYGGYITVYPGTYTENLTFYDGITVNGTIVLSGFADTVGVFIVGTHTPPLHGGISFNYVDLSSATDIFFSAAAGDCQINISNAAIITDNGYTFNLPNWTGTLGTFNINCTGTALQNNGMINNTGGALFACFDSGFGWGTANIMHTSGQVYLGECETRCPWEFETGSVIDIYNHECQAQVTFKGNTTGYWKRCHFIATGTPAITMSSTAEVKIAIAFVDSNNNPAITGAGAGTLKLSAVSLVNNTKIASTVNWATDNSAEYDSFSACETGQGQTVGAVTADLVTIDLGAVPSGYTFNVLITGYDTTTPSMATYEIIGGIRTTGAAAVRDATPDYTDSESAAMLASDDDLLAVANTAVVRVTGVAGLTINWKTKVTYIKTT